MFAKLVIFLWMAAMFVVIATGSGAAAAIAALLVFIELRLIAKA